MELAQLDAFDRVAREGNFTRAAEALNLTQPAVSSRIGLLEQELGGELFERKGRQLKLTALGERFLPYAQRVLALTDDGLQAVKDFHAGVSGRIKFAAPTPFLLSYIIDTLDVFRKRHPTVDILIRERNKTTIYDLLLDNAMTIGLVNAPVFGRDFAHVARFRDAIVPVVGASHPLAAHCDNPLKIEDLRQQTVFRVSMFPQMSAFVDEVAEMARGGNGGAVVAVPMVMARRLVLMGRGVTFLPSSYVSNLIEAGECVQLNVVDMPPLVSEPILIAYRNRKLDEAHLAFIEVLKQRWGHLLVTGS